MESKGYWYGTEDEIRFIRKLVGKKEHLLKNYLHYAKHLRTNWGNLDKEKIIEAVGEQHGS
jgi:hypothetical protein